MVLEGVWLNLQFDLVSFIDRCFENTEFKSIDSISINGPCLIRRVCTCKCQVPDSFGFVIEREFGQEASNGYEEYVQQYFNSKNGTNEIEQLQSSFDFPSGVDHMNQVISYERLEYFGYIYEEAGLLTNT